MANIFQQYLQPIRTVGEQRDMLDARDLRREQLIGAQRQNALAALTAQQTQDQMAQAAAERNMLRDLAQRYAGNQQGFEDALAGSGMPGLMTQAEARRKARIDAQKTEAETKAKQAETVGKLLTAQGELATRVMAIPTRQAAMASIKNMRMLAQSLGVDIDMSDDEMTVSQLQDGDSVKQWAAGMALKAEKLLPTIQRFGAGNRDVTQAVDPVTGQVREMGSTPIMQSPDNAATVAATREGQRLTDARAREQMRLVDQRQAEANRIASEGNVVKTETDLRKEFADLPEVKRYKASLPAYNAVSQAAKRDTPQSDINLVYGLAKLYDPDSVVREGEYATIANSQAIPEWLKGMAQRVAGGGRLTKETKAQIMTEANGRIGSYQREYDGAKTTYEGIVRQRGGRPESVFTPVGQSRIVDLADMPGGDLDWNKPRGK